MTVSNIKLKAAAVLTLGLAPVLFLVGVGFYHLWATDWSFVTYWPMAACWLSAYLLGWYWTRRRKSSEPPPEEPKPGYWTDRDKKAWVLVEEHVAGVQPIPSSQLGDLNRYAADAQSLALKVARIYKPDANDPFGHLTVPEILACGELVAHDLTKLVDDYVPGSHVLSVSDIKKIRTAVDVATDWYPRVRNAYWIVSAFINPVKTALQVAAAKGGLGPASQGFQQNIILWFHGAYLKELGRYLIELNSGRLKVGAKRYLELIAAHEVPPAGSVPDSPTLPITLAVVGPVKAGKSSLVNALLGEQKAATDIVPLTSGVTRYTLARENEPTFTLLDSAGFGLDGASPKDIEAAVSAAGEADILLLVVPARSAARKPESDFLVGVRAGFAAKPNLKMPPVIVVLSHIDLLSPAVEWAPPYDWHDGTRPKEANIRDAVQAAAETFSARSVAVIPICTAAGKELGVRDELLATVAGHLGEARGVGLLRTLHAEASTGQAKKVMNQVLNVGGQVLKAVWDAK